MACPIPVSLALVTTAKRERRSALPIQALAIAKKATVGTSAKNVMRASSAPANSTLTDLAQISTNASSVGATGTTIRLLPLAAQEGLAFACPVILDPSANPALLATQPPKHLVTARLPVALVLLVLLALLRATTVLTNATTTALWLASAQTTTTLQPSAPPASLAQHCLAHPVLAHLRLLLSRQPRPSQPPQNRLENRPLRSHQNLQLLQPQPDPPTNLLQPNPPTSLLATPPSSRLELLLSPQLILVTSVCAITTLCFLPAPLERLPSAKLLTDAEQERALPPSVQLAVETTLPAQSPFLISLRPCAWTKTDSRRQLVLFRNL
mmetsp:Transcript_2513/g.3398  ORF Transcript_2513/g.3398 Transcript_2513/m.3398 type:complete len:324 (+) Transcript_2513:2068-3039(+)